MEEENRKEENLNTLKDRRTVDTLLECLLFLSKYHKREASSESLKFNLPIHNRSLDVDMFVQSAQRIGLVCKIVDRKVEKLTKTSTSFSPFY